MAEMKKAEKKAQKWLVVEEEHDAPSPKEEKTDEKNEPLLSALKLVSRGVSASRASRRRPKGRRNANGGVPRNLGYTLTGSEEVRKLLFPHLQKVGAEAKGDLLALKQGMRSLLNPHHTYEFRLTRAPLASTISANVVAGNTNLDPSGAAEWTGILDALFDEYRVDSLLVHYLPLIQSGSSTQWFPPLLSVATDFDSQVTPTSHVQVQTYADSQVIAVPLQSASAYFIQPLVHGRHRTHVPKEVAVSGSVATVEWIDVAQAWPGGQMFYADVIGTNGTTVFHRVVFWTVKFRVRK